MPMYIYVYVYVPRGVNSFSTAWGQQFPSSSPYTIFMWEDDD